MKQNRAKRLPPPPRKLDVARVLSGEATFHIGYWQYFKDIIAVAKCDPQSQGRQKKVTTMRCRIKSGMTGNLLTYSPTNLLTNNTLSLALSCICSTLTEFRSLHIRALRSICSLSGLASLRPSANPLSLGEGSAKKRTAFTLAEVFSPHCAGHRKIAFTLAEVLITLGIIGVVAAMTMPAVITNYKKAKTVTTLKKAYSEVSNLFIDFQNETQCYDYLNSCFPGWGEFRDEFAKYLYNKRGFKDKVLSSRKNLRLNVFGEKPVPNRWIVSYFPINQEGTANRLLLAPSGTYVLGFEINENDNYYQLRENGKFSDPPNYFRASIKIYTDPKMVDNDGYKNVPTIGKDIFNLFIMANGSIIPNGAKKCGLSDWHYHCVYWKDAGTCNIDTETHNLRSGSGCLGRIIEDGWQIKYKW